MCGENDFMIYIDVFKSNTDSNDDDDDVLINNFITSLFHFPSPST